MLETAQQDKRRLVFYQPGATLRVCNPGDVVSLWEPAGSLLCLENDDLPFHGVLTSTSTRIKNALRKAGFVYIGDVVTRTGDQFYVKGDRSRTVLGEGSLKALRMELRKIGLCLNLQVPEWPPKSMDILEEDLPRRNRVEQCLRDVQTLCMR